MSDIYLIKSKKHCKVVFLPEQVKQEVADLLNKDDLFKNGVCVRKIPGKRETWKVSASDGVYYVKITYQKGLFRKLLSLLKLSKTNKEIKAFHKLKDRGILIPELLAHETEFGSVLPEKEYLIIKEVEGGKRLKDYYLNEFLILPRKEQKRLIHDFSSYIRTLHDKGIMHTDPNLGNFLIKQDGGKNYFYLLDLADVNIKSSLSLKERWNNLSLLNLSFFRRVPKSLRFYFFKNYAHGLFHKKTDITKAINIIETRTLNLAKKSWAKRIKWRLGSNSFFVVFKKGNLKIHVKKDWSDNKNIAQALLTPDFFLDNDKGIILKDGRTVKASRVDAGEGKSIFLKRYNKKGWLHTLKNIFRSSRAKRVWINSYGFELRGIPIASPVAYMEERRFRILKRSYVASEFIADAVTLSSIFRSSVRDDQKRSVAIMEAVGSEIGKMHKLGCIHGDMKWSTILIKEIDGKYKCFFVDLDGSRIKKKMSLSEIIDELSRFYVEMLKYALDLVEQEAFLKAYCRHNHPRISYKELLKRIKEKSTSAFERLNSRG